MWNILLLAVLVSILVKPSTPSALHNVSSPEFRAIAAETYRKVLPCLNGTWMYANKPPVHFEFPIDAEEHFKEIIKKTEPYRNAPVHSYAGYDGPWIENIFIAKFMNRPLHHFNGLIPLFLPWIDRQILRGRHFDYIYAELETVLRPNVIYFAVSQGDVGLGKIGMRFPNILVMSAGGFGHIPIPLIKGEIHPIPQPAKFDQDIGFFGTIQQSTRPAMLSTIKNVAAELGLTYKDGMGADWKNLMAQTKFNLAPRGYGRSSFRFSESVQIGRIPVFLYNDVPWIPYRGTIYDVEQYGFVAGLTTKENTLPQLVHQLKNMSDVEYQAKLTKLADVRELFTYPGLVHQIVHFFNDPFGPEGGYLRCTVHPKTERCCDN